MNTSYEERVKALAEEMARNFYGTATVKHCGPIERTKILARYNKAARIAVKHIDAVELQRDEAIELLHSILMMLHDGDLVANSHTNDTYIRNKISKLIKGGLIPSPEKATDNAEATH